MEPLEVTARWDAEGGVTPLQFVWKSGVYTVETTGRQWRDEAGLHILVMIPGGRVFELIFQPEGPKWSLGFRGPNSAPV